MHRLDLKAAINIGGHYYSVNDLSTLQEANIDLANIISESLGSTASPNIIAGVKKTETATTISYTGGWIYSQGYFWKVNPLATTTKQAAPYFVYFIYRDVATTPAITYQSGTSFQVHKRREIDIVYQNTTPSGTSGIDWAIELALVTSRIEDIRADTLTNTMYRNEINAPWVYLNNVDTAFFVDSGLVNLTPNSYLKYKIIGSILHLQVNLTVGASNPPTPVFFTNSVLTFPPGIDIKPSPSILAVDTHSPIAPATIQFIPATATDPAKIIIKRSHNNTTATNTVSFSVVLELA